MRFGLGATVAKVATNIRTFGVKFLKDNLKLFFDFQNTDLEHVGIGSCQFEGADDEIQIADHDNLDGMDQLTIMCWFKYDSTCDNGGNLISKEHDDAYQLQVDTSNNRVQFFVNNVSDSSSSSGISINTWHHVTCTYTSEGNGTSKIYIDGALDQIDTTFSGSTVGTNSHPLYLGGDVNSGTNFGGLMKNVGIWNRVLSDSEIQNIIYKTYSDLRGTETTGLLAWYPLESNGNDSTGNHNGTASGDITFHTSIYGGKTPTKPRGVDNSKAALADQIGSGSASFDGNDYIDCGIIDFNTDDISIVAWYKANTLGAYEGIVTNRQSTGDKPGIQIRIDDGGDDIELFTDCGSTTFSTKTNSFVPSTGVWTHVAATIDRSALQSLYINGALQATTDISGQSSADLTSADNLRIGRSEGSAYFDGNIAQVGIWTGRVLTQEEVQEISQKQYSELTTSEKTNLTSWWGLDSLHGQNAVEDKNGTESLGSEIVVNGEFTGTFDTTQDYSSDFNLVTGWIVHTAGSGGSPHTATEGDNNGSQAVRIQSSSSPGNYINVRSQTGFTLTAGTLYKLTFDAKKESTSTFLRIKTASGTNISYSAVAGTIDATLTLTDTMTTYTYYFIPTATDTSSYIAFGRKGGDGSANFTIDNISLKTVTGSNVGVLL